MNDYSPTSLFYTAWEVLSVWFWPLVVLALVLLLVVWLGFRRLKKHGRSAGKPIALALLFGLVATAVATLALPYLTHASVSVFGSVIDLIVALLLASVVGLAVFAASFAVFALRRPRLP